MSGPQYSGAVPLGNPSDFSDDPRVKGLKLTMDQEGRGQYEGDVQAPQHASLSGPTPKFSIPKPAEAHPGDLTGMQAVRHPQATRPLTHDEMMAKAQEMLDNQRAQTQGNSLSPRDAAGSQVTDANGQKLPDWLVREQENQ